MTAIKGACLSLVFSKSCGPDGGGGKGWEGDSDQNRRGKQSQDYMLHCTYTDMYSCKHCDWMANYACKQVGVHVLYSAASDVIMFDCDQLSWVHNQTCSKSL